METATQKTLSRQSLITHDRKRSLSYNEAEQYKSVVFNRAFPSLYQNWMNKSHEKTLICLEHENILLVASCSIVQIVNRRFL